MHFRDEPVSCLCASLIRQPYAATATSHVTPLRARSRAPWKPLSPARRATAPQPPPRLRRAAAHAAAAARSRATLARAAARAPAAPRAWRRTKRRRAARASAGAPPLCRSSRLMTPRCAPTCASSRRQRWLRSAPDGRAPATRSWRRGCLAPRWRCKRRAKRSGPWRLRCGSRARAPPLPQAARERGTELLFQAPGMARREGNTSGIRHKSKVRWRCSALTRCAFALRRRFATRASRGTDHRVARGVGVRRHGRARARSACGGRSAEVSRACSRASGCALSLSRASPSAWAWLRS